MKPNVILSLSLAVLTSPLLAGAAGQLGDPAAPLRIAEWVKGKPVDLAALKGKQVAVVEFWATWCPPCRASIPHLTELQKKFKDVVFIGISDEKVDTVKKFVAKMGAQMDYTVAVDDARQTSKGYMGAYGINGIPHAFIVDKQGRVVWDGHPMADLEKALQQVLDGKFDLDKARKRRGAQAKLEEFYEAAMQGGPEAELQKLGKELEALDAELGGIQPGQKFNAAEVLQQVKFSSALHDYQMAVARNRDAAELAQLEQKLVAAAPAGFDLAEFKQALAQRKLFADYYRAASGAGSPEQLAELGKQLAQVNTTNARQLNEWAWTLLTDERLKTRDLALATKLAKAAVDASGGRDPAILDTYARALFDSGKVADAVATQQKAIAAADDDDTRQELEATLKQYQQKQKN